MNNKQITDNDMPWRRKASKVIGRLAMGEYLKANKGKRRYVPYTLPLDAERLVDCLDRNDEEEAKAIMMFPFSDSF